MTKKDLFYMAIVLALWFGVSIYFWTVLTD